MARLIVWSIAAAVVFVVAVAASFPLALFMDGNPRAAFRVAVLVLVPIAAMWAVRASRYATAPKMEFVPPWPDVVRSSPLVANGYVTRTGQPGQHSRAHGMLHARVLPGIPASRYVRVEFPCTLLVAIRPTGSATQTHVDCTLRNPGADTINTYPDAGAAMVRAVVSSDVELELSVADGPAVDVVAWWMLVERDAS